MIYLYITEKCNLRCDYCTVLKKETVMSLETLQNFFNMIFPEIKKNLSKIVFMGGEPLLYPKNIIKFSQEVNSRFHNVKKHITTNLTLLNEDILKLFKDEEFIIDPSIDGEKQYHDKHRKTISGDGSYDIAIKNLNILSKYQQNIKITYTFDPKDGPIDFTKFLEKIIHISLQTNWTFDIRPIIQENNNYFNWLEEAYLTVVMLFLKYYKRGYKINFDFINGSIKSYRHFLKKEIEEACGLGYSNYTLTPEGDLWPCPAYFDIKKRKIGNVNTNSKEIIQKQIKGVQIYNHFIKNHFKNKSCDCPRNDICNKSLCIANLEGNQFKCPLRIKRQTFLEIKIIQMLKKELGEVKFNKLATLV